MSRDIPNDAQSYASATAEGAELFYMLYYALLGTSAQQTGPEMLPYVQPPLGAPSGSGIPSHPNPPYASECPYPSRGPGRLAPDPFPDPFATATHLGWEYLFQPQIPPGIPEVFPAVAVGTNALGIGHAAPWTNGHHTPSQSMPLPSASSAPAAASNTRKCVTGTATRPTAAGAPGLGLSIPMVLEEITLPYELPVLSSCDFGGTLTLGDALKDFSRIPGDSARRAFPSQNCAAKLAFWLVFNLGSDFRPRRKQVTVVTTRKGVVEQPSKARLACLVAHEMEKYLRECTMRQTPFPYTLDDIILRRIDLVSKGTLRPRLYIQVRRPRSIRTPSAATC